MRVIVVSLGASGTHFLHNILRDFTDHTPYHEPPKWVRGVKNELPDLQRLLDSHEGKTVFINNLENKQDITQLESDLQVVLLRDPRDIALSAFNRRRGKILRPYSQWKTRLETYTRLIRAGAGVLDFSTLVSPAIASVLEGWGLVVDPIPDEVFTRRVNHNSRVYASTYAELPEKMRVECAKVFRWYSRMRDEKP